MTIIKSEEYVDSKRGLLNRRIFTDEAIYREEQEKVFGRAWQFIGHDSLVPNPNDFFLTYMGEDPVILTRDAKGEVHAFLNMCRHRGNRVARADDGNAKNFMCTYHGWTYSSEGKLVSVPGLQEAYYGELDVDKLGLVSVAQLSIYAGFIFATWDPEAPSFEEYLGDMRFYLDWTFNRREGGVQLYGPEKWIIPANWKFPSDNISGDGYHITVTHLSALLVRAKWAGRNTSPSELRDGFWQRGGGYGVNTGNGNGVILRWYDSAEEARAEYRQRVPWPAVQEYEGTIAKEMEERLGVARAHSIGMTIGTVFPNFGFHDGSHFIRMWLPRGPLATEVWSFTFTDKDAPEEVKRSIRIGSLQTFGPSGSFEQDDMNNFEQCTTSGLSRRARDIPQLLSMGLGHERARDDIPGRLSGRPTNELSQQGLYKRWQEFMNAKSWSEISIAPQTAKYAGTATFEG